MFEELGITEVIDQATQQDPEMRIVTAGHAVKAMVLNGLGFVNQQLYLVSFFSVTGCKGWQPLQALENVEENLDTRGQGLNRAQTNKRGDPPHHCAICWLEVSYFFLRTPLHLKRLLSR